MHLCCGNYPGPHHCDVPLADIVDIVWKAKPHAAERVNVFETVSQGIQ